MKINKHLIEKYNQPVPRYTSYPPANYFVDSFSEENYRDALVESNNLQPENISIYIHIPFCNKLCFFCGCNSTPMSSNYSVKGYIESLKQEIKLVIPYLNKSRKISQIHYGGGTPNSINASNIKEINQLFFDNFEFISEPEIAIECHPAYLDELYIEKLHEARFNRFSLGIQEFNTKVLRNVNRNPSLLPIKHLTQIIRDKNNSKINLDFMYGLPGQSISGFLKTIKKAIRIAPDRIVTFSYAHVPWINKNQKILEKKGLPDTKEKIDMFESSYNILTGKGYYPIGMDHYVKQNDELHIAQLQGDLHRNFQGYCTRKTTGQVYAFGVSGISQLQNTYAQNAKNIDSYTKLLKEGKLPTEKGYKLSKDEQHTRNIITSLMCNKSVDLELPHYINKNKIRELKDDGIVNISGNRLEVSEDGFLFLRNVAACFDPLQIEHKKTFSKSV